MKIIGNLLLTVSLIAAMLSGATAYLAPTSLPDEAFRQDVDGSFEYARLASNAGAVPTDESRVADVRAAYEAGEISAETYLAQTRRIIPIVEATPSADAVTEPDDSETLTQETDIDLAPVQAIQYETSDLAGARLTPERLAALRAADSNALHIKKFSFKRWKYWWVFVLSAIGLFAGSMLVRAGAKAEIAAASAVSPEGAGLGATAVLTPEQSIDSIADIVESLRRDLPGMASERDRLDAILQRLGEAQKTYVLAFIDARPILVNRLGLGGYAELMDHFAAAERQINRAWSAAADGYYEESRECIDTAAALLEGTKPKLRA